KARRFCKGARRLRRFALPVEIVFPIARLPPRMTMVRSRGSVSILEAQCRTRWARQNCSIDLPPAPCSRPREVRPAKQLRGSCREFTTRLITKERQLEQPSHKYDGWEVVIP